MRSRSHSRTRRDADSTDRAFRELTVRRLIRLEERTDRTSRLLFSLVDALEATGRVTRSRVIFGTVPLAKPAIATEADSVPESKDPKT